MIYDSMNFHKYLHIYKYYLNPNIEHFNLCSKFLIYITLIGDLEKEMATHSSTLAWKIPWTEKPGRLQSMGSQRVGHD